MKARQPFICRCCKEDRPITVGLNTDKELAIGNGASLEKADKFCYLRNIGIQTENVIQSQICTGIVLWLLIHSE